MRLGYAHHLVVAVGAILLHHALRADASALAGGAEVGRGLLGVQRTPRRAAQLRSELRSELPVGRCAQCGR